jgi:hypothetical protein
MLTIQGIRIIAPTYGRITGEYIHENPVEAKLVERAEMFPYSSAYPGMDVDPVPPWLKPQR